MMRVFCIKLLNLMLCEQRTFILGIKVICQYKHKSRIIQYGIYCSL